MVIQQRLQQVSVRKRLPVSQPGWPTPFASAEEAWFWTMAALRARSEGATQSGSRISRPCDPDDIILCLDRLYRERRVDMDHAFTLRVWGERQVAPTNMCAGRKECRLWDEAMASLTPALREKRIIA